MNGTYYYIYVVEHIATGRIYVGQHITDYLNDGYKGSGVHITRALDKYGRDAFRKEILNFVEDKDALNALEAEIVTLEFCNDPRTFNMREGGGARGRHSEQTKQLMREKMTGKPKSSEHVTKIIASLTGRKQSEETIGKRVQKNTGQKRNDEQLKRMSDGAKNRKPRTEPLDPVKAEKKRAARRAWGAKNRDEINRKQRLKRAEAKALQEKIPLAA